MRTCRRILRRTATAAGRRRTTHGLDPQRVRPPVPVRRPPERPGYFQADKLNGQELWLYNRTVPRGPYLNRFLMSYLASTRLTPPLAWKVGYLDCKPLEKSSAYG